MQRPAVAPLFGCAFLAVFVAACDGSTEPPVPTSIHLEPAAVDLAWGGTAPVTAEVRDQHGKRIDDWPQGFDLDWTIDEPSIAIVDEGIRTSSIRSRLRNGGEITLTVSAAGIPPAQAAINALSAPDTIAGELGFRYSGNHSGAFAVVGEWPFDHEASHILHSSGYLRGHGAWTASYYDPARDLQFIDARRVRADRSEDWFAIIISGRIVQSGVYDAMLVSLDLGYRHDLSTIRVDASYLNTNSGSVSITSAEPDHVTGTFHVTVTDRSQNPFGRVEIEDGHFHVPLLMDLPWQ